MSHAPAAPLRRLLPRLAPWIPSRRSLLWVLAAFGSGLLVSLLIWREDADESFYRGGAEPTVVTPTYTPLPAPAKGAAEEIGDLSARPAGQPDTRERPRLVESSPPPPPPNSATAQAPAPVPTRVATSQPEPISRPAPDYPRRALRRGESGTVIVSATVSPDGKPSAVEVARSSGSRLLDRAAVNAVERWRFRPALAEGQPVTGQVQVPITFEQ